jgi:hypothetical protein
MVVYMKDTDQMRRLLISVNSNEEKEEKEEDG